MTSTGPDHGTLPCGNGTSRGFPLLVEANHEDIFAGIGPKAFLCSLFKGMISLTSIGAKCGPNKRDQGVRQNKKKNCCSRNAV